MVKQKRNFVSQKQNQWLLHSNNTQARNNVKSDQEDESFEERTIETNRKKLTKPNANKIKDVLILSQTKADLKLTSNESDFFLSNALGIEDVTSYGDEWCQAAAAADNTR